MDINLVRKDFTILSKNNSVYLDSAATSLTPDCVVTAMTEYYQNFNANIGRGLYSLEQKTSLAYQTAHMKVANFLGADMQGIIFTKNATESINIIANGFPWQSGDHILISILEHHSNFIPWLRAAERFGIQVDIIQPNKAGEFDLEEFQNLIGCKTRLVSITHISNVLGSITPVSEITSIAHAAGALVMIDASQSAPHIPIDVASSDWDFMACSGHKMMGPTGSGILYIKPDLIDQIEPLIIGGGIVQQVSTDSYALLPSRAKFEGGTPDIAAVIGLGAAVDYIQSLGQEVIAAYEADLTQYLMEGLLATHGVEVYGLQDPTKHISLVSFNIQGYSPHRAAAILDELAGLCLRSGQHCCQPLMNFLGHPEGSLRASLSFYNTREEIDLLLTNLQTLQKSNRSQSIAS